MTQRANTGRRPGPSGTRGAIEAAARRQFAELGFDRTSMRQVAMEAGVDPALVSHFYGSKQQLFVSVVALPFDPAVELPRLVAGDREAAGRRLAEFALGVLETESGRSRFVGLIRAAASEPEAGHLVRERLTREVLTPFVQAIGSPDAAYRASLVMSQIVGLIMARYIVAVEPLATRSPADVATSIAPTLQGYLTGPV